MVRLIQVSGLEDPALDIFTRLSEVQLKRLYEPHGGLFIAESPKVVMRALDAGCEPVALLLEDRHVQGEAAEVLDRCDRAAGAAGSPGGGEIPAYTGPYEVLTKLTGYALTRGVLCAMRRPPLRSAEEVLGGALPGAGQEKVTLPDVRQENVSFPGAGRENVSPCHPWAVRRVAVLENVMNPANVGSIFRNAAALGIDAVLLTDGCSDPLYRRTLRVSMGTTLQVPWAWTGGSLDKWRRTGMQWLREQGFRTIAMALREDAVGIRDLHLDEEERAAILLGAEGDGLMPETIAAADDVVMIPMMRGVDSLNVAAASAVAFYAMTSGAGK